jgi:four helix bundle protein
MVFFISQFPPPETLSSFGMVYGRTRFVDYRSSEPFPKHEVCGLSPPMRRAAVSVANNIAEGKDHRSDKEFRHFLFHAEVLMERETQILLAGKLQCLSAEQSTLPQSTATQVGRSLSGLINAPRLTPA